MKITMVLPLLAVTLFSPVLAVVTIPISRKSDASAGLIVSRDIWGRASITESLFNNISLYQASLTVGTPPQQFSLQIDTGSSDIYVMDKNCDQCISPKVQAANHGGCYGGTFDSNASSTYKLFLPNRFQVAYADKTGAIGDFIFESIALGGITVQNQTMGVATKATTGNGLLGIGYDINEAQFQTGYLSKPYPSLVDSMLAQGLINTQAYSLYLDDQKESTGSVIFGGADTAKFLGPLSNLPIIPEKGVYREFLVNLTNIAFSNQTGSVTQITSSTFAAPFLLDSGTTYTYVPNAIFQAIGTIFRATLINGILVVDCNYRSSESAGFFIFGFGGSGGPVIHVPTSEFVLSMGTSTQFCQLGIRPTTSTFILGDTFLRSAYVVYDLTNNQIGIAQTNFDSTSSNIVDFNASSTGIPTLTGAVVSTTTQPAITSTSKAAADGVSPPFNGALLAVLAINGFFAVLGSSWFLA